MTVLIVDDHDGFRSRVRSLLESEGYAVIGEAADGASGLAAAARLRPQLVILDVMLPDASGFTVADRLTKVASPPTVVLVSTRQASDFGGLIDRSPAAGFISKMDLSAGRLQDVLADA